MTPKGFKHSVESRRKIGDAQRGKKNHLWGKHQSEQTKKKISEAKKGKRSSSKTEFKKGMTPWNKGKHTAEETRKKQAEIFKKRYTPENHYHWQGGKDCFFGKIARRTWRDYYKKNIPVGYVIHHKDKNNKNNHIGNLELMTREAHISLHHKKNSIGANP